MGLGMRISSCRKSLWDQGLGAGTHRPIFPKASMAKMVLPGKLDLEERLLKFFHKGVVMKKFTVCQEIQAEVLVEAETEAQAKDLAWKKPIQAWDNVIITEDFTFEGTEAP